MVPCNVGLSSRIILQMHTKLKNTILNYKLGGTQLKNTNLLHIYVNSLQTLAEHVVVWVESEYLMEVNAYWWDTMSVCT